MTTKSVTTPISIITAQDIEAIPSLAMGLVGIMIAILLPIVIGFL